ncbi:MAG: CHASE2 domain-containing protein, partial [Methylococcaceae bacterium]|nr:CHASE2 domain-containing protein [Methylococcaceae bacterium]
MKWFKKFQYALLISVIAISLIQILQYGKLLEQWEYSTWSWRQRLLAKPSPATDEIKVILLDQASLDWGASVNGLSWPWPREVYGLIINFLQRADAKVIAFDVIYSEASLYGVEDDQQFAAAITNNPVIMGVFLGRQKQQQKQWPPQVSPSPVKLNNVNLWLQQYLSRHAAKFEATFPINILAKASPMLAHVNESPDSDGVFRRFSLFYLFDNQVLPSMGLAAFLFDKPNKSLTFDDGFLLGKNKVITDNQDRVILKFRGASGTHQSFNAAAIIQAELRLQAGEKSPIDLNIFKDKYVFFGFSAPGLKDLRPTPVSGDYPGVEVHATLLDNLLAQDSIKNVPKPIFLSVCFLLAMMTSYMLLSSSRIISLTFYSSFFVALPIIIGFSVYELNYWWYIVPSEIIVIFAILSAITFNYISEGKQKRFIRSAFNQYLSGDVINQILDNPDNLKLGGEKRELSIFFSDIEGFTSISEKLSPEELVQMLNEYLTDMTDIIMDDNGGTLDKYEGDAIIAFWNAPVLQLDHAVRICRATLLCQRKLAERREEFYQRTGSWVHMRIGVHSGEVVVGNFGSTNRFDYTMIGDSANLAARLEGANKFFGSYTMISEATWKQASDE